MWLKNVIYWLILTRSLGCNFNLFDFGRFCGAKVKNIFFAIIFVIYVKIAMLGKASDTTMSFFIKLKED